MCAQWLLVHIKQQTITRKTKKNWIGQALDQTVTILNHWNMVAPMKHTFLAFFTALWFEVCSNGGLRKEVLEMWKNELKTWTCSLLRGLNSTNPSLPRAVVERQAQCPLGVNCRLLLLSPLPTSYLSRAFALLFFEKLQKNGSTWVTTLKK